MQITARMQHWWVSAWGAHRRDADPSGLPQGETPPPDIEAIRQAMRMALGSCAAAHRARAQAQIARADSVLALWLLRSTLYQYLAQDLGEAAATERVAALLPMFGDAVPGRVHGSVVGASRLH